MSDQITRMLYEGAVAVQEGRKAAAQELLMKVIELDEQNEQAWLWLSGAVNDPSDQQIALENVLALNPNNREAQAGLRWLQQQTTAPQSSIIMTSGSSGEWVPPPPIGEDEVSELHCWQCNASVYSVAEYCWQCHSPIHSCKNCNFANEIRCKELQGLTNDMLQNGRNQCPWWRVGGGGGGGRGRGGPPPSPPPPPPPTTPPLDPPNQPRNCAAVHNQHCVFVTPAPDPDPLHSPAQYWAWL
jgi:hypothetical protein